MVGRFNLGCHTNNIYHKWITNETSVLMHVDLQLVKDLQDLQVVKEINNYENVLGDNPIRNWSMFMLVTYTVHGNPQREHLKSDKSLSWLFRKFWQNGSFQIAVSIKSKWLGWTHELRFLYSNAGGFWRWKQVDKHLISTNEKIICCSYKTMYCECHYLKGFLFNHCNHFFCRHLMCNEKLFLLPYYWLL